MSRILIIIPARGGSKRVPRKNIKLLQGHPLIAWSILAAQSAVSDIVVVSTDDDEIASIARHYNAEVPFLRSPAYATDSATVIDAVLEVVDYYENTGVSFEAVLLLQPTSPFRSAQSIMKAIAMYEANSGQESVVSVSPAAVHPFWFKQVEDGVLLPFDERFDVSTRSQDLPNIYQLNGSVYLSSVENLRKNKSFYSGKTQALVIESEEESLDIDTQFDWLVAETIAKKREKKA
ncbi:MAG: acylneuraminate cytidylyltransferase family protein [Ghiorsea sp.]|nr:acylneuraminate cytidylyltransferase family protein [Ghiorsea sp.]